MPRPKQQNPRDRQFNIGLTAREWAQLHRRAAALGMRPVDYGRARLFAEWRVAEAAAASAGHLDPLLLAQLSRIGNVINQIARRMHVFGQPAPPSLDALLQQVRALISRRIPGGS